MTLLTAPETLPFSVALLVMIGIGVIEGAGILFASSPSALLEHAFSLDEVHAGDALGWLHVGKVPLLVLLVLFLLAFAVSGYLIQMLCHAVFSTYLPGLLTAVPATLVGLGNVNMLGGLIARIIPAEESAAVSEQTLIGRTGVVVTGRARAGMAAEVKVRDQFGNPHYLMLEPDLEADEFEQGTAVLIVRKQGAVYKGIRNPHPSLI